MKAITAAILLLSLNKVDKNDSLVRSSVNTVEWRTKLSTFMPNQWNSITMRGIVVVILDQYTHAVDACIQSEEYLVCAKYTCIDIRLKIFWTHCITGRLCQGLNICSYKDSLFNNYYSE